MNADQTPKTDNNRAGNITGFEQLPTNAMLEELYNGQMQAAQMVRPALAQLAGAVNMAAGRIGQNGRLVYVGAGTSGRLAVQDGVELGPTYGWPDSRTIYLMAGGVSAMLKSVEGAEDSFSDGEMAVLDNNIGKNDIVICVAASGRTPFTLGALRAAKSAGALTISFVTNKNTPILTEADFGVLAETGAEIPSGSTRMKAGTAQKIMLNMFSTALMARLGRIYDGFMVDMVCSNTKLRQRAVEIVCKISDCHADKAKSALLETDYKIKPAILLALGVAPEQADALLASADNDLRLAMQQLGRQSSS